MLENNVMYHTNISERYLKEEKYISYFYSNYVLQLKIRLGLTLDKIFELPLLLLSIKFFLSM